MGAAVRRDTQTSGIWRSRPAHEHTLGLGGLAFEVWTQTAMPRQTPAATRAHGWSNYLEHMAVASDRTKEHTTRRSTRQPTQGGWRPCIPPAGWLCLRHRRRHRQNRAAPFLGAQRELKPNRQDESPVFKVPHPFCRVVLMAPQWTTVLTSLAYCGALFKDEVALLREQGFQ